MIKNKHKLLAVPNAALRARRKITLDIIEHVLTATSPHALLKPHLKKVRVAGFGKIAVIALGKAARTMGAATLALLPSKPDYVLYADTGHPLPTAAGMAKTKRIMKIAQSLGPRDLAIVLISGGGSAMFVQPAPGITLDDKIATTKALLKCGATINEINCVRKHLSQVKGGRLARLLAPATVKAFVISDVVGNDLSTIASGTLSADPTTFKDALGIIEKYRATIPAAVRAFLKHNIGKDEHESVKKGDNALEHVSVTIVADHYSALNAAADAAQKIARKTKHRVSVVKEMLTGEARDVAQHFVQQMKSRTIIVASGETTVTCTGDGFGGRNQEFALSALGALTPNQTLASVGTDGIDGMCPTKVAGAIADAGVLQQSQFSGLNIRHFLQNNDSYSFFKKAGALLVTGPTGNNLGDVVIGITD